MIYALYVLIYIITVFIAAGIETSTLNLIGRKRMAKGKYYCNLRSSICMTGSISCREPSHQSIPANPEGMFKGEHPWWFVLALVWPVILPIMVLSIAGFSVWKLTWPALVALYNISVKGSSYILKEIDNPRENVKQIES